MKILEKVEVPTGHILVVEGEKKKPLELLSLGDYGKDVNLKANFLGLDRNPSKVNHTQLLPLTEKWVITISAQYGCSMNCSFCDVPLVGPGKNATRLDLINQVLTGLKVHSDITWSNRLNVHFARMGEPTWNPAVLDAAMWMKDHLDPEYKLHPVVSTMMPRKNEWLKTFIHTWMRMKNRKFLGNAGLQLSINSTDAEERRQMFHGNACSLEEISQIMYGIIPSGRKITLNFAIADYIIDPDVLLQHFHPEFYVIKLTPMHKTISALDHGIKTKGDYTQFYPYEKYEQELLTAGYDVLVFIASHEEDDGKITCGNAILATGIPKNGIVYEMHY